MDGVIQTYQSKIHRSYIMSGSGQIFSSIKEDKIQASETIISVLADKTNIIPTAPPVSLFSFYINVETIEKCNFFFKSEKNFKFS